MGERIDVIVPILQRIRADIADLKRDLGAKIDRLTARMDDANDRMRRRGAMAAIKVPLNGAEAPRS